MGEVKKEKMKIWEIYRRNNRKRKKEGSIKLLLICS
jgi:hypothetical protein